MKKNKIYLIIVLLFMIAIIAFFSYKQILSRTPATDMPYQREISYLNEDVDFELLIYGEKIVFPEGIKYKNISSLDDNTIFLDNDYVYVIINDIDGTTNFTKEDLEKLVNYADHNSNFNFYYIGLNKLDMIKDNVIDCNINTEDLSFGYIIYQGNRLKHYGVWSKNDEEHATADSQLGENICEAIYGIVKSNE